MQRSSLPSPSIEPVPEPEPIIVVDNGSGVQTLIMKFATALDAVTFAHLSLPPATRVSDAMAKASQDRLVATVGASLLAGGSGPQAVQIEWGHKNELSLNSIADGLSRRLQSRVAIEIPGVGKVLGKL